MQGLDDYKILDNIEFNILEHNNSGDVVFQPYFGGWLFVDNGYRDRPTAPPQSRQAIIELRFAFQHGWSR